MSPRLFGIGSLNAKSRRAIARSLGAPKNVKTSDANALISDVGEEELKTASIVYLEDEMALSDEFEALLSSVENSCLRTPFRRSTTGSNDSERTPLAA